MYICVSILCPLIHVHVQVCRIFVLGSYSTLFMPDVHALLQLPASFKLEQVEDLDTKSVDVRSRPGGRKALDIEKIIVQTDSSGHLLGKGRGPGVRRELALIRVSVQPAGVMGAFGGGNVKEIVFNIGRGQWQA
eukprot:jgi/Mesen1/2139/ME000152S01231